MSNPTKTSTTAKQAAKEDALPTGGAGLPGTKPVGVKPRLSEEERAAVKAKRLADHERLLDYRVQQVLNAMDTMGIASLRGRITEYTDVSPEYVEACLLSIEEAIAKCRAAAKARQAPAVTAAKVDLRALAAKLQAQRAGTPAVGQ